MCPTLTELITTAAILSRFFRRPHLNKTQAKISQQIRELKKLNKDIDGIR